MPKRKAYSMRKRRVRRKYAPKRRKNKTYSNRQRGTIAGRIRRSAKNLSLRSRVKILEGVTAKHYDTMQRSTVPQTIEWYGTTFTGVGAANAGESFPQALAIQGRDQAGDRPLLSDRFCATDKNTRESQKVWVSRLRLRGLIRGAFSRGLVSQTVINPAGGGALMPSQANIQSCSKTKVWCVVLRDKRCSTVDGNGNATINPLPSSTTDPQINTGPLQGLFQSSCAGVSTLETFGFGQGLSSYENQRFKVVYAKAFELTYINPEVEFDITININKAMRYSPARAGQSAQSNQTEPLNTNYITMFCCKYDMPHNTMPDGSSGGTPTQYKPTLTRCTSRLYFKDV